MKRYMQGAALLAFLLTLIVSSTWLLLSDLNAHTQVYTRRTNSELALNRAKRALLFYAMNYPDLRANPEKGPGFLPCPDRDNDGRPETNCAAGTGTTLGRLPFTILGLDDPRDSSGERLWYALSADFKNTQSNNAVVNSETPGQLSVDGNGDVVAVIIAPGGPVGGQYARPGNAAADYLEGGNADVSDGSFTTRAGNDQVATISRAELMAVVEQRVINEIRATLARYYTDYSAYPWLTPFADPRADNRVLRGAHTGSNNVSQLTDKRTDFTEWGVAVNDVIRNVTDGSVAVVTAVAKKMLNVAGHSAGVDNDFDKGDIYFIELRGLAHTLSGTGATGSKELVLKDIGQDFKELGIAPGDVIENVTDGSSGMIKAVTRTTLTANSLSGGMENDFDFGEIYRLRSNTGVADSGSNALNLVDPHADFIARGILAGDIVENLSDGSIGRVKTINGTTTLSTTSLNFGRVNVFGADDVYRLPRYNGRNNVRKGLLSVHVPGKTFPTGFAVEWSLPIPTGSVVTGFVPGAQPLYVTAVLQTIQASTDGATGVDIENGQCTWLNVQVVECTGVGASAPYLEGIATSGSAASVLVDTTRDFITAGVKPGDLVDEPYTAVVTRVGSATVLSVRQLSATSPDLDEAEYYRIKTSTRILNGLADALSGDRMQDSARNFNAMGVMAGDIVENVADGSFGLITDVSGSSITATLHGGVDNDFELGDEYNIHYAYVNRRRYKFNLRYQGSHIARAVAGSRQRDVCRGYGDNCGIGPSDVILPYHATGISGTATPGAVGLTLVDSSTDFLQRDVIPGDTIFNTTDGSAGMVTTISRHSLSVTALNGGVENDFDAGDTYRTSKTLVIIEDLHGTDVVASAALTVPPGNARGSIRTNGIDYYLSEAPGELPTWFIKNKWHQLLYVAYSAGFVPGGSSHCTAGTDCLVVRGLPYTSTDREALVVSAGMALTTQDRSSGVITDYYEDENATLSANDIFDNGEITTTFNDQLAVISP